MTYVYSDNDFSIPINGFEVTKFSIVRTSNVIGAPVESGQKSFDNKVVNPVEIKITGVVETENFGGDDDHADFAVSKLNEMQASRKFKFYSVETDCDCYKNLILKDCPFVVNQNEPGWMVYELTFVEAMLVQAVSYTPSRKENASTKKNGNQNPKMTSAQRIANSPSFNLSGAGRAGMY